ncbi:ABC transporter substrate-binding protein [Caenimonas sedimenti]|nr:ABC transporter substrate-binding protein [Caenimonas sedimenti]
MNRRDFVLAAAAGTLATPLLAARTEPGVTDTEILLGQSAVLTGPLSPGALALQGGARIAFEDANAKGIHGRRIKLLALDDAFDPARAQTNYRALVQEHKVFACVLGVGGLPTLAGLPVLREANVPLIAPAGVVDSVRDKTQGSAYYTRASQQREADALVSHFATLGMQKVAVAHIATPGGQEVLGQVQEAITRRGLQFAGSAGVAPDGSNTAEAGKALAAAGAQAVILFLSGPSAAAVMKGVWALGAAPSFYGMSILAGDVTARLLGEQSKGLAVSQVMPYPWDAANADANGYRKACEKAGVPVGYHSYEGYLAGGVVAEALRKAGRDLTRERLHASLRALKMRLGGVDYDFTNGRHTGTQFVELVRVRADGKFVR